MNIIVLPLLVFRQGGLVHCLQPQLILLLQQPQQQRLFPQHHGRCHTIRTTTTTTTTTTTRRMMVDEFSSSKGSASSSSQQQPPSLPNQRNNNDNNNDNNINNDNNTNTNGRPGCRPTTGRGAFIVLEGVDRCGKTTQVARLVTQCLQLGWSAQARRFPNRTTVTGQLIHQYLTSTSTTTSTTSDDSNHNHKNNDATKLSDRAIHLLFSANRWEAADDIIATLESGTHIICDRYAASGVAFSAAKHIPGMTLAWCQAPDVGLPAPDAIFFLDMDPAVAAQTRGGFGEERYEQVDFQKAVVQQFRLLQQQEEERAAAAAQGDDDGASSSSSLQWHVIDATQDMDTVQAAIWTHVQRTMERVADTPVQTLWTTTTTTTKE